MSIKNPIIVALDGMSWDQVLPVVDKLRTTGCILKVNDLLFREGFRNLLPKLSVYGRVMADLKCHDIPNTVANTCRNLRACPPWAVTVHGSGGKEMIEVACKELQSVGTKVLVVTVLSSIDPKTCEEIYHRKPAEQVMELAQIAKNAGADGLVCSSEEVSELRGRFPKFTLVVPGIRSSGADPGDQKRISTPKVAINRGADYIVMGRQILSAKDPVEEVNRILKNELGIYLNNM
ncbi:MAG: orotidine-5'-phosphate decarboxylase [Candidatus Yanofskybacteria bacterium]|nr:orotidine-5'-phosphate decarboxylase [Candidatus Yanofskybacteria bacterium]